MCWRETGRWIRRHKVAVAVLVSLVVLAVFVAARAA